MFIEICQMKKNFVREQKIIKTFNKRRTADQIT